ncbi:hypothetical protein PRZ48_004066 [Zasmidium cellare]|uniref:F-box domain-containing protein n=1 Tax=Zasmidium cellare TaxID=395010 RepID=A0ABR0EWU0_ZASCE|nr:hypothetical protein PRZ48_004066 [Zasmidium cellare]
MSSTTTTLPVRILTQSSASDMASFEKYPKALLPENAKKKPHKLKYCMRLARNLEHFDKHPEVWGVGSYAPLPPLLRLPPELRQKILDEVLDDDEVRYRPNYLTQSLAVVCKTFSTDVKEVSKLWDKREAEQAKSFGMDHASMRSYIAELNGDREKAVAVLAARQAAVKARKNKNGKRGEQRRRAEVDVRHAEKKMFRFNNKALRPAGTLTKLE